MPPTAREDPKSHELTPARVVEPTVKALLSVLAAIHKHDGGLKADDRAERESLSSIRTGAYSIRSILKRASELSQEIITKYTTDIFDAVEDAVKVDQRDLVLKLQCAPWEACACLSQKTNKKSRPNCHALCHSAHFRFPNSAARDHLRQTLNDTFDELQTRLPDQDAVPTQEASRRLRSPQLNVSTSAEQAFHAILRCRRGRGPYMEKCRIIDHSEPHLALATYLGIDEEDGCFVDLLFALDTDRPRCDEVRMHTHCPVHPGAFADASTDQRRKGQSKNFRPVSHFCELLNESRVDRNAVFRVNVFVDANSDLWQQVHPPTHRQLKQAAMSNTVSLAGLLASDTRELNGMAKLVLAVILSYSLFYLFDGPWLGPRQGAEWSQRNIIFFKKGGKIPLRPFLRSDPRGNDEGTDEEEPQHQHPAVLCFGITLLEIHLESTIESFLGLSEPLTSLDNRWARACEAFEMQKASICGKYREVIKACLNTNFGICEDENGGETGDWNIADEENLERLRGVIFNDIVRPLHDDLVESFGTLEDFQTDLDKQIANLDIESGLLLTDVEGGRPTNYPDNRKRSTKRKASTNDEEYAQAEKSRSALRRVGNGNLHGLSSDPSPQSSISPHGHCSTDRWFTRFRSLDALAPLQQLQTGDQRRIRVAIIDTGIDMGHIEMQAAGSNGQIAKVCTWIDGREGADDDNGGDSEGHGTHIASVILGMAPHVDLYIARVTRTRELFDNEAENVAKAIRTAASTWKCDIISLSLGFTRGVPCIQAELESAIDTGTLVFAAASNDGANSGLAYPAWHSRVFCTYSTDGYGNKSPFHPPPEQPGGADGFSIVGQHIRGAWPSNLSHDGANDVVRRLSGTSCATPVAAAVAACVMGFANIAHESEKLKTKSFLRLASYDGMRRVLWKMTKPMDGYQYLNPFGFFDREKCDIEADIWKALNPEK